SGNRPAESSVDGSDGFDDRGRFKQSETVRADYSNSPRTIWGDKGGPHDASAQAESSAVAAAASLVDGSEKSSMDGSTRTVRVDGSELLAQRVSRLESDLLAARTEVARLAELLVGLQGVVLALQVKTNGKPIGVPTAAVSEHLRVKIERAVDAWTTRQWEGEGFTSSEAAFRAFFRNDLTAKVLVSGGKKN